MNTTPPPTREERLERAASEMARFIGSLMYSNPANVAYHVEVNRAYMGAMIKRYEFALHPAVDGEETKP